MISLTPPVTSFLAYKRLAGFVVEVHTPSGEVLTTGPEKTQGRALLRAAEGLLPDHATSNPFEEHLEPFAKAVLGLDEPLSPLRSANARFCELPDHTESDVVEALVFEQFIAFQETVSSLLALERQMRSLAADPLARALTRTPLWTLAAPKALLAALEVGLVAEELGVSHLLTVEGNRISSQIPDFPPKDHADPERSDRERWAWVGAQARAWLDDQAARSAHFFGVLARRRDSLPEVEARIRQKTLCLT